MILFQRKLYFSKDSEGVQHFPGWEGGSQLFPGGGGGGPNANFYRNPYNLRFYKGSPDPLPPPPLDPLMLCSNILSILTYDG